MEVVSPEVEAEFKASVDSDGKVVLKRKSKIRKGKKSKASGNQFEARVRADLEAKGWIVDKWSNNVDLEAGKIVPAKRKFNPFSKVMTIGTGFPDFVAFQNLSPGKYNVIGVEVKTTGTLSRIEKEKCRWCLEQGIFSEILVAEKVKEKNRVRVQYTEINEILSRMR